MISVDNFAQNSMPVNNFVDIVWITLFLPVDISTLTESDLLILLALACG